MDKFEDKAKNILKDHEVSFNPAHWEQLSARLDAVDAKKKRKKGAWLWWMSAGLAAASIFGFWIVNKDKDNSTSLESESHLVEKKKDAIHNSITIQEDQEELSITPEEEIENKASTENKETFPDTKELFGGGSHKNNVYNNVHNADHNINKESKVKESNFKFSPEKVVDKNITDNNGIQLVKNDEKAITNLDIDQSNTNKVDFVTLEIERRFFGIDPDLNNLNPLSAPELVNQNIELQAPPKAPLDQGINLIVNASDLSAYNGVESGHNLLIKHETNWKGIIDKKTQEFDRFILSNPSVSNVNYNASIGEEKKWFVGLDYEKDVMSRWELNSFRANLGHQFSFGKNEWLRVSTGTSLQRTTVDTDFLTYMDQIDPTYGYTQESNEVITPTSDVLYQNLGLMYKMNRFFTAFELGDMRLAYLNHRAYANVPSFRFVLGYNLSVGDKWMITPSFERSSENQQTFYTPSIISNYNNQWMSGIRLRNMNTLTFVNGFVFKSRVRLNLGLGTYLGNGMDNLNNKGYLEAGLNIKFKK